MQYLVADIREKANAAEKNGFISIQTLPAGKVEKLKEALVIARGGSVTDFLVEPTSNYAQADLDRVSVGDEFVLVWTGDVATGFDFSDEDAKFILRATAPETYIDPAGSVVITFTLYKPDGITVHPANVTDRPVAVSTPQGPTFIYLSLVNGVGTFTLDGSSGFGRYLFPSVKKMSLNGGGFVRIEQQAEVFVRLV